MRVYYLSKRGGKLAAAYFLALVLLLGGASVFLPETAPAAAQPEQDPAAYRSGSSESDLVSLAINVDWGEEYLPQLLAVLAEKDVHATFFLTGRWCNNQPELARQIAEAGHEIGNHGYSHSSPNASSEEQIIEEIERTEAAIEAATGITTDLYAPPSGEDEQHVLDAAAEAGYHTILWSVDTIDWQQPTAETIVERVSSKIHGGAIILAHPTEPTLLALPQIIDSLEEEGYRFVSVSENLGL